MLKLEIKMDDSKIITEKKYSKEGIYQALTRTFTLYHLWCKLEQKSSLTQMGFLHWNHIL